MPRGKHGSLSELKLQLIEEMQKECMPLAGTVWNGAEDKGLRQADVRHYPSLAMQL